MATSREYLDFILDQLSGLDGVTHRAMMGEYILYLHGKIAAYLCDDRLLVKPVAAAVAYLPAAVYERPYEGAKESYILDVEDHDLTERVLLAAEAATPLPKPRKKGRGEK